MFRLWHSLLLADPLKCEDQSDGGPTCGTSLNLMKRLMYAQLAYNPAYVSFENMWFEGEALSPIGVMQASAKAWIGTCNRTRRHCPCATCMC